jgi:hypothetical protein
MKYLLNESYYGTWYDKSNLSRVIDSILISMNAQEIFYLWRIHMLNNNDRFFIAVDSETGSYFHGERKLHTQAQIDQVIQFAVNQQHTARMYKNRGQPRFYYVAWRFIRTMVNYCKPRPVRFI